MRHISISILTLLLLTVLSACAVQSANPTVPTPTTIPQPTIADQPTDSPAVEPTTGEDTTALPGNLDGVYIFEDDQEYVISQLLPRDGILPIYDPRFIEAKDAELNPGELVMGVEINGDARAYPVGVLRSREMVIDEIGGTPVLVTW